MFQGCYGKVIGAITEEGDMCQRVGGFPRTLSFLCSSNMETTCRRLSFCGGKTATWTVQNKDYDIMTLRGITCAAVLRHLNMRWSSSAGCRSGLKSVHTKLTEQENVLQWRKAANGEQHNSAWTRLCWKGPFNIYGHNSKLKIKKDYYILHRLE